MAALRDSQFAAYGMAPMSPEKSFPYTMGNLLGNGWRGMWKGEQRPGTPSSAFGSALGGAAITMPLAMGATWLYNKLLAPEWAQQGYLLPTAAAGATGAALGWFRDRNLSRFPQGGQP